MEVPHPPSSSFQRKVSIAAKCIGFQGHTHGYIKKTTHSDGVRAFPQNSKDRQFFVSHLRLLLLYRQFQRMDCVKAK